MISIEVIDGLINIPLNIINAQSTQEGVYAAVEFQVSSVNSGLGLKG